MAKSEITHVNLVGGGAPKKRQKKSRIVNSRDQRKQTEGKTKVRKVARSSRRGR